MASQPGWSPESLQSMENKTIHTQDLPNPPNPEVLSMVYIFKKLDK